MTTLVEFSKAGKLGLIIINNPPVNATSQAVRAGVKAGIEAAAADPAVEAIVLACKGRTFIAGADIREFGKPPQEPRLVDVVQQIENSEKPVIAAIHGTALGGGLEIALACHFRVATSDAKLGLPEVKLGLLPGAGGTQRLPRLIGVEAALEAIVEGTPFSAQQARVNGLIDEIIEGDIIEAACAFAQGVVAQRLPVRRTSQIRLEKCSRQLFDAVEKRVRQKKRGHLAPLTCIQAVKDAVDLPFAEGMAAERGHFVGLAASPQSKALRHVFFAEREAAKVPGLDPTLAPRPIRQAAVIGAGTMGGGIAMCFANAGIPVLLLDMNAAGLEKGLATLAKNYANSVKRGSLTQADMDRRVSLIRGSVSYDDLHDADIVIEAVFEDMEIKRQVFTKLDAICKPGAILATNTSYLNVDVIAQTTSRPEDVLGMHFFSPANVMKLLENVRGAKTSPQVCATVMALGKQLGKNPVLVGVCDGFVGNRMLSKRTRESYFMLEEGATPQQIDKVLYDFGLPMGPFAMADLAGLDVGWRNRQSRLDALTPREQACDILDQLFALNRYGQKTGAGFYQYDSARQSSIDPQIDALILAHSSRRGITRREISDREILERCLYAMINEGAKLLEEGIVSRALDIDVVWLNGYGFPAYRGGPMFYADQIGLQTVYEGVLKYERELGSEYWTPSPLLAQLASEGRGFYTA